MSHNTKHEFDRRSLLTQSAALGGVGILAGFEGIRNPNSTNSVEDKIPGEDYRIQIGRAKQSVMAWCFQNTPKEKLIDACAKMGLSAMEGIDKKFYPLMKEKGLGVSITGSHGFAKGPVTKENHSFCADKIKEGIDLAVQWGAPGVITFTGMTVAGMSESTAIKNCVECWKSIIEYAEQKQINVVLEMLNTVDDTHPMKGHPGYFGNDIDLCIDLIKAVDSPRMKLLFDIYHVQIMNGDVIRNFKKYGDYISHVHTAGNPGRCEIDENQEINYPAVIKAILETGYDGYIAQEFIPNWEDELAALRHGVKTCDVD